MSRRMDFKKGIHKELNDEIVKVQEKLTSQGKIISELNGAMNFFEIAL